jgi:hypothetical protein
MAMKAVVCDDGDDFCMMATQKKDCVVVVVGVGGMMC